MGTLQEQALAGTMREEFELSFMRGGSHTFLRREGEDRYADPSMEVAWQRWQKAYAAGQRAEREACAAVAEYWYFGDPGEVNHSIAAAIRNRKEQG